MNASSDLHARLAAALRPRHLPAPKRERVAFTGARTPGPGAEHVICARLRELDPSVHELVTGGCVGVDAYVARVGKTLGFRVYTVLPADRSRVDPDWRTWCDGHECMPPGTDYMARNTRLAQLGERLIAFPKGREEQTRSGTWSTVRRARSLAKPVTISPVG